MLGGVMGGGGDSEGGLVGKILGQHLGIEGGKANKLLSMIGPLLLGALAKKKSEAGGGGALDMINNILDEDGDGNALNDLAAKFLGGGGDGGGGGLGGMLGGLMGGKD